MTALKVGQEIKVQVQEIDFERGRISLTAKKGGEVNRSTGASSASTGQRPQAQNNQVKIPAPAPELKNKAFAGLKNIKL